MAVKVEQVEFKYSDTKILDKIMLDVSKGECLSIVGPNGAGKSTLVKCIIGLLSPQKGTVLIDGENLLKIKSIEVAKKVGYVPQSQSNVFPLKVFDMVLLGRRPHVSWRSSEDDLNKVINALKILDIEHLSMRQFNEISGGQQQKVIIARALAQEPKILLLDEPISNLDIKHQLEVMELVKELSTEYKITSIMVVHDLNIAARYSDKVAMMHNGRIQAYGQPEDVLTKENISNVYDVDVEIGVISGKPYIVPLKSGRNKAETSA